MITEKPQVSTNRCQDCSPKDLYMRFLQSLYLIYGALEHELESPTVAPSFPLHEILFKEQLFRRSALERDLTYYLGPGWKSKLTSTKATDNYIARIKEVGRKNPDLLLAHHSTRYIGDLQSCDKSRARTRRLFGLPFHPQGGDGELNSGVAFHVFEGIEDKQKFLDEYFQKIRAFDLPPEVNRKIAREAKVVYQLNLSLYWELQELVSKAGEEFQSILDSKYQSFCSDAFDRTSAVKEAETSNTPDSKTEESSSVRYQEQGGTLNRPRLRCCNAPLFLYSLMFWLLVLFVACALCWYFGWVNFQDVKIFQYMLGEVKE